jgi:hypothetical protein
MPPSSPAEPPRLPVAGAGRPRAASPDARPTCPCGHDRHHHAVLAIPTFGVWAWIALFMGVSGRPKQVTYRCRRCGTVVETTRDPADLRAFR